MQSSAQSKSGNAFVSAVPQDKVDGPRENPTVDGDRVFAHRGQGTAVHLISMSRRAKQRHPSTCTCSLLDSTTARDRHQRSMRTSAVSNGMELLSRRVSGRLVGRRVLSILVAA